MCSKCCYSFLIQALGAIKYIVNMWENVCFCSNICYHFAKYIAFLYHNIPFVYITIIMRFIIRYIIYHDYCGITTLYITAIQAKELVSLYQVQHGVSIQPHLAACVPGQSELSKFTVLYLLFLHLLIS